MINVNNDRDTPNSRNVASCFAKTLYTFTNVSQHFGQLPFEKGKAQTAPHLTLCQFMHHHFGQGVYLFSRLSSLGKSRLRQKVWRITQQIAPTAKQEEYRQHRDQIDLIKTNASVVLAPSQRPDPCCLYGVVRQPSKRILFILCDHSAVFDRSCVLEKGLCSNCTS